MAVRYLLDTNVLVHCVRGDNVWQRMQAAHSLLMLEPLPLICVVSVGELRSLALQFNWQTRRLSQMEFILEYFDWVNIDRPSILNAYAEIDAWTRQNGRKMGKNDLWIAASAAESGDRHITTDRDFISLDPIFLAVDWIDPTTPAIAP